MGVILKDKVALITGSSSGIGRSCAVAFAREGSKVVVSCDKDLEGGNETVRFIKEVGGDAIFVKADVSCGQDVEFMVKAAIERYGRLDCAVNNAAICPPEIPFIDHTEEQWEHIININLKGVWWCMKYELKEMEMQGKGTIVNISSLGGLRGLDYLSVYVASKHGVLGLTKTAALEYAKKGIRINAVCPSLVRTGMSFDLGGMDLGGLQDVVVQRIPMGRLGEPNEIAETVLWLCSDLASFATGSIVCIDGGYSAR